MGVALERSQAECSSTSLLWQGEEKQKPPSTGNLGHIEENRWVVLPSEYSYIALANLKYCCRFGETVIPLLDGSAVERKAILPLGKTSEQ